MKKSFYYAFFIPKTGENGITSVWAECEKKVKGVAGARFQKFQTMHEAKLWLGEGARYEKKEKKPAIKLQEGIYFDSGTGRGDGVEISVTDKNGKNLLHKVIDESELNVHGKHHAGHEATNNYGELLALKYAIQIAKKTKHKKIFGDSKLVIEYWSMGIAKAKDLPAKTVKLIFETTALREAFEEAGGKVLRIPGGDNPADLGFHRG